MTDPHSETTRRDLLRRLSFRMAESSPDEELRNSVTTSGRDQVPGQNASTEQNEHPTQAFINRLPPSGGSTIRLSTSAMACEFSVIMNPGPASQIDAAGEVLECVHEIESWLSVYRSKSELSIVNERAGREQIPVSDRLFALLRSAMETWKITGGGFDMATGSLIQLWRRCRKEERIPTPDEIELARARSGSDHVELDEAKQTIRFQVEGLSLDPGAIGKGYALD
ncbi:MAG: FAD:protein FMN transferase, partial [Planctomyces sp.]